MSEDVICMSLPANPDYILTVRLTVSAVAKGMGFNIEEIEDIKMASAEGCIMLLSYHPESMNICMTIKEDSLDIDINAKAPKGREQNTTEDLSQYFLEVLVDEFSFIRQGEMATGVHLIKKCKQLE